MIVSSGFLFWKYRMNYSQVFSPCFMKSLDDVDQFFTSAVLNKMKLGIPLLDSSTSFVFMTDESLIQYMLTQNNIPVSRLKYLESYRTVEVCALEWPWNFSQRNSYNLVCTSTADRSFIEVKGRRLSRELSAKLWNPCINHLSFLASPAPSLAYSLFPKDVDRGWLEILVLQK